jgi:sulfite dehydrogenase (cytochrome) subunit B
MRAVMRRKVTAAAALLLTLSASTSGANAEDNIALKPGPGRDLVEGYCNACHSLDYPRINATFLNRQDWESEVNKMIKAYGAPIGPADAKIIVDYLVANYGRDH